MTYQTGRNILVSYLLETVYGILPGNAGAKVFRPNSGGLNLTKAAINSNENRRDGMMTRGRHGSRSVTGPYAADLSLGSFDPLIEAVFRGTFDAALVITEATAALASITTTANTIVAAGGSWITAGLRVGDIIRLTNHATAGNNSRNLRITDLTATVITVAETLIVNAVADTAFTISRPKKVIQGLVPRSFTFEEAELDIDGSELFKGVRVGQMQLQLAPNGMTTISFTLVGQDSEVMTGAQSPYFTAPTETVSIGMTAVEAVIRLGDVDVLDVSALDFTIDLKAAGFPVVGSNVTPDVFTNLAEVTGNVTALRADVTRQQQFLSETQLSLHLMFTENEIEPRDFCAFHIGNFTLAGSSKSELGSDGPRTQSFPLMIGKDQRGGAFDPTMIKYQTSAA